MLWKYTGPTATNVHVHPKDVKLIELFIEATRGAGVLRNYGTVLILREHTLPRLFFTVCACTYATAPLLKSTLPKSLC